MNKLTLTLMIAGTSAGISVQKLNAAVHVDTFQASGGQVVTVGPASDSNCDFNSIQAALDSSASEIRIADDFSGLYTENLLIDNQTVTLNGAFLDCTAAANGNENGFRSTVEGNGAVLPAIRITGNSQRREITLKNLTFVGGTGTQNSPGGGISVDSANVELILENIGLFDNVGNQGGGIAVVGGNADVRVLDVQISNNRADSGGGVYCNGTSNSIVITDSGNPDSGIFTNQATNGDGGGVLIAQGCHLTSYSGSAVNDSFLDFRGINRNNALGKGGGIAVESGAQLDLVGHRECHNGVCEGNNTDAVTVIGNTAGSFGGGISVSGQNSSATVQTVNLRGNSAPNGGGFYLSDDATLVSNYIVKSCWQPGACNQINGNQADASGGAFYVLSGALAEISNTYVQNNRADTGTVGYVVDDGILNINSTVMTDNGNNGVGGFEDNYLLRAFNDGAVSLNFSTITSNAVNLAVISNGGTTISVQASIVHNPGINIYQTVINAQLLVNCLLVHEDDSISGNQIVEVDDPNFVAPLLGDYHIAVNSHAVDLCNFTGLAPKDIDLELKGFDDPNVPNVAGTFDAGADELLISDVIFADGFE